MELLWDGGTNVCSNGPRHMTKMATMPIYGKNLKKSSSAEPKGWWPWILVCIIGWSSPNKFGQMMTLDLPWPILQQGQIWSLMLLYGKKGKTMDFSETIVIESSYRWLKWQEVSVDIKILSPGGCMSPAPGLYTCTCIKSWNFFL